MAQLQITSTNFLRFYYISDVAILKQPIASIQTFLNVLNNLIFKSYTLYLIRWQLKEKNKFNILMYLPFFL